MIVFDANVLIAYLDADDDLHADANALLAAAIDDVFGVSSLTLAEVLVAPVRTGHLETVTRALSELEMHELPSQKDTAVRLAQLRVTTGLKMPDCCVLLAAEDSHATLASFDDRLVQAAEQRNIATLRR
jgi:predicted nucleic acid-binding protein